MAFNKKIKVLIVDDSMVFRESIARLIAKDSSVEVVGTAPDVESAKEKIAKLDPDVMTLDVHMPKMSGIDFLKDLMKKKPMPVVVVSSASSNVLDALNAGAVDFVTKPQSGGNLDVFAKELVVKIKIASIAKLKTDIKVPAIKPLSGSRMPVIGGFSKDKVVAIGASTGGTEATLTVLKQLPKEMPGIVIVQHMPAGFTRMYAERADRLCKLSVKEAADGDRVEDGRVLIAPGEHQMYLKKDSSGYYVSVRRGEKVSGHAPSVNVLFNSVAETAGKSAVGVILTGMGQDGAEGLLAMHKKGAKTIGQDEKSCVVYGMPRVAFNIGAVDVQADINVISDHIMKYLR
ncbi:MAG: chemotaxis response regulator protein-glutamate methylesterase [Oscillospiraceae bacterium]|nr:chemotaxis response regulator protein-glutamate methylesterase [Oscillospiraceae bacterium]